MVNLAALHGSVKICHHLKAVPSDSLHSFRVTAIEQNVELLSKIFGSVVALPALPVKGLRVQWVAVAGLRGGLGAGLLRVGGCGLVVCGCGELLAKGDRG